MTEENLQLEIKKQKEVLVELYKDIDIDRIDIELILEIAEKHEQYEIAAAAASLLRDIDYKCA